MATTQELVVAERREAVGIARLNRPDVRNALSPELMQELADVLDAWDSDPGVRCIVIAGGDEYFAAGADIKAMRDRSFQEALLSPLVSHWQRIWVVHTPMVAAVSGYALGGGCELALSCDMIVASETAEFGQPEILLGIIPGAGGTQRIARVAGKQRAMELVLTGRRIDAQDALRFGLVNQVTAKKDWLEKAVELAGVVARRPRIAGRLGKQAGPAGGLSDLAPCDLVIEAAPGRLELKRELFEQLSRICRDDVVLASNTSSILISSLASATEHPENVVGMHFFNPPPLMRLLEVISAEQTGERALTVARETGEAMDKTVVVARDGPGFLVN